MEGLRAGIGKYDSIRSSVIKKFISTYRYIFQYPHFKGFNKSGWEDISNNDTWNDLVSFTIPRGYKGVLKSFSINPLTIDSSGLISYRLLINNNPHLDYEKVDNIFTPLYGLHSSLIIHGGYITIPLEEEDIVKLQLLVPVAYGSDFRAAYKLRGWYWNI